jgi:two-component system CheB/CheR fusion protein
LNGLQITAKLRERLGRTIPVIILTGDILTQTLRDIAQAGCLQLNKPVKPQALTQLIQRLLSAPRSGAPVSAAAQPIASAPAPSVIFIVDDDAQVRGVMQLLFEESGKTVEVYPTGEAFLEAWRPGRKGCLLIDAYLPGMSGLELLRHMRSKDAGLPAVMITGNSDVSMAVEAMKAGALDFIEKPVGGEELLARVKRVLEQSVDTTKLAAWRADAINHLSGLTPRQHEIMRMVLAGIPNKNIAVDLGISQRTVENHRASIMRKTGSKSLPALARLALVADYDSEPDQD